MTAKSVLLRPGARVLTCHHQTSRLHFTFYVKILYQHADTEYKITHTVSNNP